MARLKNRKSKHVCKCGLEKEIDWQGNGVKYPVFSCPNCGSKRNEWEIWWEKYKDRWKDRENWQKPAEMVSCIVGYFVYKYNEFYGQPYTFSYINPIPYKDKDFMLARRLLAMFDGNAKEVLIYIKWFFAKILKKNYNLTSIGLLVKQDIVTRFKLAKAKNNKIKRQTPLPKDFLGWCLRECSDIFEQQELSTWNDLNGLITHVKSYGKDNLEWLVISEAINRGMLSGLEYKNFED